MFTNNLTDAFEALKVDKQDFFAGLVENRASKIFTLLFTFFGSFVGCVLALGNFEIGLIIELRNIEMVPKN
jgi:hypothetical protein